ncbi:MAG: hypothetical protein CMH32_01610 [Micavibrio sp.]|nr:hypothetical protein [Micavibrio sp.]
MHFITNKRIAETGSALVYILIAIALMAALTATFVNSDSQQSRSQNSFKLAQDVKSQIQTIKAAIEGCTLLYPGGDITVNDGSTTDAGFHNPFPVNPSSAHFTGSTLGAESDNAVSGLRCPGNPGDTNDHEPIFGAASGQNLSPAPGVLEDWMYFNGTKTVGSTTYTGVYISTRSNKTDPYIAEAFDKVASTFSACEADSVDDSDDDCASGYVCLRYWIIRSAPAC